MKLEIEVSESDIIDQNEYADWYLSRANLKRVGEAENGMCHCVDKDGNGGSLDLQTAVVAWDDEKREDTNCEEIASDNGYWAGPAEDFDCIAFVWGVDTSGGEPVNVLFGIF